MSLKPKLLDMLYESDGVSGEEIAARFGVTRASVWKTVKALIRDDYNIEAVGGVGYRLLPSDVLSEYEVRRNAKHTPLPDLFIYDSTDSTNTRARIYAIENPGRDGIFIANTQTSGRGRMGRSFYSEGGSGLYISFLLHPKSEVADAVSLTAFAAVAVCRAIERVAGIFTGIKWVNDIIVGGKKAAGILTEGSVDTENGILSHAVIGIGVNLGSISFPEEIRSIATSIEAESGKRIPRAELAACIIEELLGRIDEAGTSAAAAEYRKRSTVLGRDVTVIKLTESYEARVLDINDRCELVLACQNGEQEILATGEVSIRPSLK